MEVQWCRARCYLRSTSSTQVRRPWISPRASQLGLGRTCECSTCASFRRSIRIPPLETVAEAQLLVDEALWHLRSAGAIAEGRQSAAREGDVAARIVEESARWQCESIILGSRRLRGIGRISGSGVRERVLRSSPLPVIVAPTPTVIRSTGVPSLRAWTTTG
jgi:nucleotide-binding universal stress UspA family protein